MLQKTEKIGNTELFFKAFLRSHLSTMQKFFPIWLDLRCMQFLESRTEWNWDSCCKRQCFRQFWHLWSSAIDNGRWLGASWWHLPNNPPSPSAFVLHRWSWNPEMALNCFGLPNLWSIWNQSATYIQYWYLFNFKSSLLWRQKYKY